MGEIAAERAQLTSLTLPRRGLDELLRGWTSDGQVFEALGAIQSDDTQVDWSARDIERRASRVLLEQVEPDLCRLPHEVRMWLEHLPVATTATRLVSSRPLQATDWATTARRYGWPPTSFAGRPRSRVRDETTLRVLAWAAKRLGQMLEDVRPVAKLLAGNAEPPIATMIEVVEQHLDDIEIYRPDRLDVRSLASSGTPWSTLASIANTLLRAETDLEHLAYEIIEPQPDLVWRLFHLSVLGEVLASVRSLGGRVKWVAPLSAAQASGPQFYVSIGGDTWDLWFEASAASRWYGVDSPYRAAVAGVAVGQKSIGADIMLCLGGKRALSFECKWSADGQYVGRHGYHQASSYLVEARSGLAHNVWSYVIGPSEVVPVQSQSTLGWSGGAAVVGVGNIEHVEQLVRTAVFD